MAADHHPAIVFTVPLIPAAKGRPRFARVGAFVRTFTPAKTDEAERNFVAMAARFAPDAPFEGVVEIDLTFMFPIPTSWPKWRQEAAAVGEVAHTSRPDVDNVQKLVLDALTSTGRWWRDDAQIASLRARKLYSLTTGTIVRVCERAELTAASWKDRKATFAAIHEAIRESANDAAS